MKNLSVALGITEPAIYRHFENKAAIVRALIGRLDDDFFETHPDLTGLNAVFAFINSRFDRVLACPDLAVLMFSEELFVTDDDFAPLMTQMMHRHKTAVQECLKQALAEGTIRTDVAEEMLFPLIFGPVRLMIKNWGLSGQAFDLKKKGATLIQSIQTILKK